MCPMVSETLFFTIIFLGDVHGATQHMDGRKSHAIFVGKHRTASNAPSLTPFLPSMSLGVCGSGLKWFSVLIYDFRFGDLFFYYSLLSSRRSGRLVRAAWSAMDMYLCTRMALTSKFKTSFRNKIRRTKSLQVKEIVSEKRAHNSAENKHAMFCLYHKQGWVCLVH